jgi:exodeoxyribonuclease V gamma subunit
LAEYNEQSYFDDPGQDTLLTAIQSDILNLNERGKNGNAVLELHPDDRSIQFHNCHGPTREIEVLYDNLLSMFDADPELLPKDIVVMTPDIESFAPYIQAVFDNPESDNRRIPFTIADRGYAGESRLIETFISILELVNSRYEVSRIVDILQRDVVFKRFSLAAQDIELIIKWLKQTNVRWGYDSHHKADMGLPQHDENTWKFGLDRLLLGYALPGFDNDMFGGILPYDNIEGESGQILGKFTEFTECLFKYTGAMSRKHRLDKWVEVLLDLCRDLFISDNDTEIELQVVRKAITGLQNIYKKSGYSKEVGIDIIKQHLKDYLTTRGSGHGFIAGSVTFCAMLPMRSIPFKVICLIGMNSDAYPRQAKHLSFDLIAQNPQPGDRSVRNIDHYIFLEAILSSRQSLYISYSGQSIQDNTPIPPSVLVSELFDYIDQGFVLVGKPAAGTLITRHPLQAFSRRYFNADPSPGSYSIENCRAAEAFLRKSGQAPAFFKSPLPAAEDDLRAIDIDSFCGFFANPARYLLKNRLGIYFEQIDSRLEDEEPYTVTGLTRYKLDFDMLERYLKGEKLPRYREFARATGVLPHGRHGQIAYDNISNDIATLAGRVLPYLSEEKIESPLIEFKSADYKIAGTLTDLYSSHHLKYRPAATKAKDILKAWIIGLLLNAATDYDPPKQSIFIGRDKTVKFGKIADASSILNDMLNIFNRGLLQPLPLFPEMSLGYASDIRAGKDEARSLNNCLRTWRGGINKRAERDDPYSGLCFDRDNPLTRDFRELSLKIFNPVLENMIEIQ